MFSFRMISDTRIECQNANTEGESAWICRLAGIGVESNGRFPFMVLDAAREQAVVVAAIRKETSSEIEL